MVRRHAFRLLLAAAAAAVLIGGTSGPVSAAESGPALPAPAARTTPAQLGTFHPVDPHRVVDTRSGLGGRRALREGETAAFAVTAATTDLPTTGLPTTGLPTTASAVVVNVTATRPVSSGYLTVFPDRATRPGTSTLNFTPGASVADLATVRLVGGKLDVYNGSGGPVDVLLDVAGWYDDRLPFTAPADFGSRYLPLPSPQRLVDATLVAGSPRRIPVAGRLGVPVGAAAVVVNVTMAAPSRPSYVTLWPSAGHQPRVSTVNAPAGDTRANLAVVKLAPDGTMTAALNDGRSRVVVDLVGAFVPAVANDAGRLSTLRQVRLLDTRPAKAVGGHPRALAAGETMTVQVGGRGGVPAAEVDAVVLTVTAVAPAHSGHLTVWSSGEPLPATSTVNFARGVDTPNATVVRLTDGRVDIHSNTAGVQVLVDVSGWYASGPTVPTLAEPAVAPAPPGYTGPGTGVAASVRTDGVVGDATIRAALAVATPVPLPSHSPAATARRSAAGAQPLAGIAQQTFPRWSSGYLPSSLYRSQVGQLLFFDLDATTGEFTQGPVLCSGSVVGVQTVLTAAHCIYDDDGATWGYGLFFPGLQGAATQAQIDASWQVFGFQSDHVYDATPNLKEPGAPYWAGDYAALAMYPEAGRRLGEVIAPLPVAVNAPTGTKVTLGYPVSRGTFSEHCTAEDCYQWYCQSPTGGYVKHADGWAEVGLGCPTGNGNSGGPILASLNGIWTVVSVASNIPPDGCDGATRPDCPVSRNLWGPVLNSWTKSLIAATEALVPPPMAVAGTA